MYDRSPASCAAARALAVAKGDSLVRGSDQLAIRKTPLTGAMPDGWNIGLATGVFKQNRAQQRFDTEAAMTSRSL